MHLSTKIALAGLVESLSTQAAAALTYTVSVGYNALSIWPYEFNAVVGDRILFEFYNVRLPYHQNIDPPSHSLKGKC